MYTHSTLLPIVIIVLLFGFTHGIDQSMQIDEYTGLITLYKKIGVNTTGLYVNNACQYPGIECTIESPYRINTLLVDASKPKVVLTYHDFEPFMALTDLTVQDTFLSASFLQDINEFYPLVKNLKCINNSISWFYPKLKYKSLQLINQKISQTIPLSFFTHIQSLSIVSNQQTVSYVSDLVNGTSFYPKWLTLQTGAIMDLSNLTCFGVTLYLTNNFNGNTTTKFSTWSNIQQIELYPVSSSYNVPLVFPASIATLKNLTLFRTSIQSFQPISNPISLNSSPLTVLSISRANNFNANGSLPFIDFNPGFESFAFENGLLNTIDLSILKNVNSVSLKNSTQIGGIYNETTVAESDAITQSVGLLSDFMGVNVDISNNELQGSVPSITCDTVINLSYNQLTGDLPSCLTCFLGDASVRELVTGNSFNNFNETDGTHPPCTTLSVGEVGFYKAVGKYATYNFIGFKGTDLGLNSEITTLNSSNGAPIQLSWKPYTQNKFYVAQVPSFDKWSIKIKVTFVAPNQQFELDFTQISSSNVAQLPSIWDEENPVCEFCIPDDSSSTNDGPHESQSDNSSNVLSVTMLTIIISLFTIFLI